MLKCDAASLIVCFSLLLYARTSSALGINDPNDIAAIDAVASEMATSNDPNRIIAYYAPGAVVFGVFDSQAAIGQKKILSVLKQQGNFTRSMKPEINSMETVSDGTFACVAMQVSFSEVIASRNVVQVTLRRLSALKKINDRWTIVQEHISFPTNQATGLAVIDGPPVMSDTHAAWNNTPVLGPAVLASVGVQEVTNAMMSSFSNGENQLESFYGNSNDTWAAEMLVFDAFYPGVLNGVNNILSYYEPVSDSISSYSAKFPFILVDSDGLFAIAMGVQSGKIGMKDGRRKLVLIRESDCLDLDKSGWHPFFEMSSFPMDKRK